MQYSNYINKSWHNSDQNLEVKDKYSSKKIADISLATEDQVEYAITCAREAFERNRFNSKQSRINILKDIKSKIEDEKAEFAKLISMEAGKPIAYSKMEVDRSIATIDACIRELYSFDGEIVPMGFLNSENKNAYFKRVPLGVILGISPFNFPLNLAMHKIAPAIATGNAIIVKPAPQSPLSLFKLAEIIDQTNLDKGMFNALLCSNENAEKLVRDSRIDMLSFTGSPQIGWMLKEISGKKKIQLELGGNAASIVDEDADLNLAVKPLVVSSFLYAGQICISTQRIYVHKNKFDEFVEQFIAQCKTIQSGDPSEIGCVNGPVISKEHIERIDSWVNEAKNNGAVILYGGKVLDAEHNVYSPTVINSTNTSMKVNSQEAFAPIVVIESFENIQEAVDMVNDSKFGLQASIYSNNFKNIQFAHERLEVGAVIVNDIPGFRVDAMPYGGVKDSGLGREGLKYTMEEYTEKRMIVY